MRGEVGSGGGENGLAGMHGATWDDLGAIRLFGLLRLICFTIGYHDIEVMG